jgi:hypothetical protein
VQVLKVETDARAAHRVVGIGRAGLLDLDRVGAPVGQLPHGGRPCAGACEVEDDDAAEGQDVG